MAADNLSRALAATGNTLDDYRDPDRRRAFHASYGAIAVSSVALGDDDTAAAAAAARLMCQLPGWGHGGVAHAADAAGT